MTARVIAPPRPLSADTQVVWDVLAPALVRHGLRLEDTRTARHAAALAYALAMDVRLQLRRQTGDAEMQAAVDRQRPFTREMARSAAWALGLIDLPRIQTFPLNAAGEDVELWEFAPVNRAELEAAAATVLGEAPRNSG